MPFDNWSFTKITRGKGDNPFSGLATRPSVTTADPGRHYWFLLVDDEMGVDEERAREYLEYICGKDGEPLLDPEDTVHLFHTDDFNMAQTLLEQEAGRDFDAVFLDLRDNKSERAYEGLINHAIARNVDVSPPYAVLVISNFLGEDGVDQVVDATARLRHHIHLSKTPYYGRHEEEHNRLWRIFEYIRMRRYCLDQPWAEAFRRVIGNSVREELLVYQQILSREQGRDTPVVILGETGTGKELVARWIHAHDRMRPHDREVDANSSESGSLWANYVPVLVASIPTGTLESELFGIEKHQGIREPINGYCRDAGHGTLFIDEVGDLPPEIQGKFLRFLQEGEVRPVGASKWYKVKDVRKVFATHRKMEELFASGKFREDFIQRIDGFTIRLKPLRERQEDYDELIDHFIRKSGYLQRSTMEDASVGTAIENEVRDRLKELCAEGAFTGNIRQFGRFVHRLMLMTESGKPAGWAEFDNALKYSIAPPQVGRSTVKPLPEPAGKEVVPDRELETLFAGMGWNEFIQAPRKARGECMRKAEEQGYSPREVVTHLVSRSEASALGLGELLDSRGKRIFDSGNTDRKAVIDRLTSIYSRNKKAWTAR